MKRCMVLRRLAGVSVICVTGMGGAYAADALTHSADRRSPQIELDAGAPGRHSSGTGEALDECNRAALPGHNAGTLGGCTGGSGLLAAPVLAISGSAGGQGSSAIDAAGSAHAERKLDRELQRRGTATDGGARASRGATAIPSVRQARSERANRMAGNPSNCAPNCAPGQIKKAVPEIDANAGTQALAFVAGLLLLAWERGRTSAGSNAVRRSRRV